MKKHIAGIIGVVFLAAYCWGQGTKEAPDAKKSQEEIEIMQGILNTTFKFVSQNSAKQGTRVRFSTSRAFLLPEQGAVFLISNSGGYVPEMPEIDIDLSGLEELQDRVQGFAREMTRQRGTAVTPAPPQPPLPPQPPQAPAGAVSEKKTEIDRDALKQAVEKAQEKAKRFREQAEASRQNLRQSIAEVKVYLIEALANYGDSLTTVKPDEYINLVITTNERGSQKSSDVISARKSWVTDYKAGRMTLESFKQKVLQYSE